MAEIMSLLRRDYERTVASVLGPLALSWIPRSGVSHHCTQYTRTRGDELRLANNHVREHGSSPPPRSSLRMDLQPQPAAWSQPQEQLSQRQSTQVLHGFLTLRNCEITHIYYFKLPNLGGGLAMCNRELIHPPLGTLPMSNSSSYLLA